MHRNGRPTWQDDRWRGIERPYGAEDVDRLRGTILGSPGTELEFAL